MGILCVLCSLFAPERSTPTQTLESRVLTYGASEFLCAPAGKHYQADRDKRSPQLQGLETTLWVFCDYTTFLYSMLF